MSVFARDRIGERYGRLVVVGRAPNSPGGDSVWECICDCGTPKAVRGHSLGKYTNSCGCLQAEKGATFVKGEYQEVVSYRSAHTRVVSARGNARDHQCVACGGPASDWAYDHNDRAEVVRSIRQRNGRPAPVAYSMDPMHCDPRCRPCHQKFDKLIARLRQPRWTGA